mgnify:FL=1
MSLEMALLAEARDEAAVLAEILELIFWAAEGLGDSHGAALARGAMLARDRVDRLRALLRQTQPP